jgi:hypothetical protein
MASAIETALSSTETSMALLKLLGKHLEFYKVQVLIKK